MLSSDQRTDSLHPGNLPIPEISTEKQGLREAAKSDIRIFETLKSTWKDLHSLLTKVIAVVPRKTLKSIGLHLHQPSLETLAVQQSTQAKASRESQLMNDQKLDRMYSLLIQHATTYLAQSVISMEVFCASASTTATTSETDQVSKPKHDEALQFISECRDVLLTSQFSFLLLNITTLCSDLGNQVEKQLAAVQQKTREQGIRFSSWTDPEKMQRELNNSFSKKKTPEVEKQLQQIIEKQALIQKMEPLLTPLLNIYVELERTARAEANLETRLSSYLKKMLPGHPASWQDFYAATQKLLDEGASFGETHTKP